LFKTKQVFVCVTSWALNEFLGENILGKSAAPHPLLALHQKKKKKYKKIRGKMTICSEKKENVFPRIFFSEWIIEMDHHE
jgi:low affinity Fe/Cu permease